MQNILLPILISSLFIMSASLIGIIFTWKILEKWLMPKLKYLIALASGVFTVIVYGLLHESLHNGITAKIILAFILGGILLEVITALLPGSDKEHHHEPHPEHNHTKIDARRIMISDSIHNIHDGLALVPAFLVSMSVGFGTAAGILIHEIVQEISEFFIYREVGYSVKKALTWNFISSSTILFGVFIASKLASIEAFVHPLIAFSAGGFSYILFRDLFPNILQNAHNDKKYTPYVFSFLIGFMIMLTVSILVPHEKHNDMELPEGFGLASVILDNKNI